MGEKPPPSRQRILLVTGMLGAGKTTALRELEDLGWEAIDNFPIRLLDRLVGQDDEPFSLAIGFDCRTRGFVPADVIEQVKRRVEHDAIPITTLFLDCAGHELERRFNETRRRHFLAQDLPVSSGISGGARVARAPAPLGGCADGYHRIHDQRSEADDSRTIRARLPRKEMTVTVSSFGFSRGKPPTADLVFDMRYLDNPHWEPGLKEQTGLDAAVGEFIEANAVFASTFEKIRALLLELLPRYAEQGKAYVNIAFGCTGGRHRSVYTAEKMAQVLRDGGFSPTVLHRNLASRAAELVEGSKQQ